MTGSESGQQRPMTYEPGEDDSVPGAVGTQVLHKSADYLNLDQTASTSATDYRISNQFRSEGNSYLTNNRMIRAMDHCQYLVQCLCFVCTNILLQVNHRM